MVRALAWIIALGIALVAPALAAPASNEAKPVAAGGKAAMRTRCLAAVAQSGMPSAPKPSAENAYDAGPGNYLFEFKQPDGGSFFCQICDDSDPGAECGNLGLNLSHRPAQGEQQQLPAELDRKCVFFLQKELARKNHTGAWIDRFLVGRIQVTAMHTDARYVYRMDLDEAQYRCVIRKSDGNFLVEHHEPGDKWKPIATGVMF